jgi:hypothetical protein
VADTNGTCREGDTLIDASLPEAATAVRLGMEDLAGFRHRVGVMCVKKEGHAGTTAWMAINLFQAPG